MQESCKNHARFYAMIYPGFVKIILTDTLSDHAGILQESCKILIRRNWQDLSYIILLKLARSLEIL